MSESLQTKKRATASHDAFCECRQCCLTWESVESSLDEVLGEELDDESDSEDPMEQWAREIAND